MSPEQGRVAAVRAAHERRLLARPNVVGVGEGTRHGEPALLVFVTHRIPAAGLEPGDALPEEIDGVPVKVVEVGDVRPQQPPRQEEP